MDEPLQLRCECREGFLSSAIGLTTILRQNEDDFCVPAVSSSNVAVTAKSLSLTFDSSASISESSSVELWRLDPDNEVEIDLEKEQKLTILSPSSDRTVVAFDKLRPGYNYKVTVVDYTEEVSTAPFFVTKTLHLSAVTSCSCENVSFDKTGRPKNFVIVQVQGHVMFEFDDNSYCEEAYSFTRVDVVDEFLRDFAEGASSFTSDFEFSASEECGTTISPGTQASDDLSLSNLIVGNKYSYCVRAVKQGHYMDAPYERSGERRLLTSSESTCDAHVIRWEASIHGRITTEPNAGSLPIEEVLVSWELLSEDKSRRLECDGCSGSNYTTEGGGFNIPFNVDHPSLKGKNDDEIPVRIFFSKTSIDIEHVFLCNEGIDICDPVEGHIAYLSHLQFKDPLHVYDDTSVPLSGKVFIADTSYAGADGCAIANAEVCLFHNTTGGTEAELVCVNTEPDGSYLAPVIIGSTVNFMRIVYHGHTFELSAKNPLNGVAGVMITADGQYTDYDYQDVSKAKLLVEGKLNLLHYRIVIKCACF